MDVIFSESGRKDFIIEVGYFDTVQEIKRKIENYYGIPILSQTLLYNGHVMSDACNTEDYNVHHGTRIKLIVDPIPLPPSTVKLEDSSEIKIIVNFIYYKKQYPVNIEAGRSVHNLKEKILHEIAERPRFKQFVMLFNGGELEDEKRLEDYGIKDGSEIDVVMKPFPMYTGFTGYRH